MISATEAKPGDPSISKRAGRPRWTIGRVVTDLAISMIMTSLILRWLEPPVRSPYWSNCGDTPENNVLMIGLLILGVRTGWLALKALNDAFERWMSRLEASRLPRKTSPPDDF